MHLKLDNSDLDVFIDRKSYYIVNNETELKELIRLVLKNIKHPPSIESPLTKVMTNK